MGDLVSSCCGATNTSSEEVHKPREEEVHKPREEEVHKPREEEVHKPREEEVHKPSELCAKQQIWAQMKEKELKTISDAIDVIMQNIIKNNEIQTKYIVYEEQNKYSISDDEEYIERNGDDEEYIERNGDDEEEIERNGDDEEEIERNGDEEEEEEIKSCLKKGHSYLNWKKYKESREYYEKALELIGKIGETKSLRLLLVLNQLAAIAMMRTDGKKDIEFAQKMLKEAFEIIIENIESTEESEVNSIDPEVCKIILKNLYEAFKDNEALSKVFCEDWLKFDQINKEKLRLTEFELN